MSVLAWGLALFLGDVLIQPGQATPGDIVAIEVTGVTPRPHGLWGSEPLTFGRFKDGWLAFEALSVETEPGTRSLEIRLGSDDQVNTSLDVLPAQFRKRELTVGRRFTHPSKAEQQRSKEDQAAFAAAFRHESEQWFFEEAFEWPRLADITAPFGDLRLLNGAKQSQHYGLDLDGRVGAAVTAANSGKVVLVRDCFASGKTILIHHGGRLFTAYFHLSSFGVKMGQRVERGQPIGKVGKTGRVTGPHLHFGVKLHDLWMNPESLLRLRFTP